MMASLVKNRDSFALGGAWLIYQIRCGCEKCLAPGHRNAASLPARAVRTASHRDVQPGSHKAKKQKPKPPYILPIQEGSAKGWKARDRGPCLNFTTQGMVLTKCMELIFEYNSCWPDTWRHSEGGGWENTLKLISIIWPIDSSKSSHFQCLEHY